MNRKQVSRYGLVMAAYVAIGGLARSVQAAEALVLDESCTVSILNRTVQVAPGGGWAMPNVPSFMGQVRARATCIRDSQTVSGQSEYFTIVQNGSIQVQFFTSELDPIPTRLTIQNAGTLTGAGSTLQLAVQAQFADGSTRDVTNPSSGVNYNSSSPAIASVTPDGLVTAVGSGTALLIARKDGAIGVAPVNVITTGDSDGDGLPDDYERANGLDPNDPVDAEEDQDSDGLSALQEFGLGTNPRNADTDGDGISDGEEVSPGQDGFVTNPLVADTDGDGINDGLEVTTGTDPTDSSSFNLAAALSGLQVSPTTGTLVVNTISSDEVFRQLTVTGNLIDGSTINLTSTARGTNYASSDLTVCNFGTVDGRVFAGNDGSCTITATNNGFSAQASFAVQSFAPTPLSFVAIPGAGGIANNVDVSANVAYVAAGTVGLQIVDVSNRSAPVIVASVNTPGNARDVKVVANTAFVADGTAGLQIIDLTDPLSPTTIGVFDTPGDAQDVVIRGGLAYVADGAVGLQIINIGNPASPTLVGSLSGVGTVLGVDVTANNRIAVLATGAGGVKVVDVANPVTPSIIGSVATSNARDVFIVRGFAFVADLSDSLTVVAIGDPTSPRVMASTPRATGGLLEDVTVKGEFAFGADVFFVNGVPIVSVSVPTSPEPRAILDFRNFRDDNGTGIAVDNEFVYLTANRENARLYIGQYRSFPDADNDGLRDDEEAAFGTDPNNPDTDGDGLLDGFEVDNELNPLDAADATGDPDTDGLSNLGEQAAGSKARNADTDGDGLNDGQEVNVFATNPVNPDSDADGLNDGFEVQNGLDPLKAVLDPDGDGLDNFAEIAAGTSPVNPDTDADGLGDNPEINVHGTNPINPDTDGDGLTDGDEVNTHGTNPLNTDTDGDGLPDGWEIQHFGNQDQGPDGDFDGDGLTNIREFQDGSDPTVPAPPGVVGTLTAVPGDAQNVIFWSRVDTGTSFNLYWSVTPGVTKTGGNQIPDVTSPFVHTGLTNGTTYSYVLTSVNAAGESAESPEVSATPVAGGVKNWSVPIPVSEIAVDGEDPQIAVSANGNAVAAWFEFDSVSFTRTIRASYFTLGSGWSAPTQLEANPSSAASLQAAMDVFGNAQVVWTAFVDQPDPRKPQNRVLAARYELGTGWGAPVAISALDNDSPTECNTTTGCTFGNVDLAVNDVGEAIAAFQLGGSFRRAIYVNRFVPGQGWGTPTLLTGVLDININPQIVMDSSGNATLVHTHFPSFTSNQLTVRAQHFVVGSGWGMGAIISTADCEPRRALVGDADGNVLAIGDHFDFTTLQTSLCSRSFVPGVGWGPPVTFHATNSPNLLRASMNANGQAVAVWQEGPSFNTDIFSSRFDFANGWSPPELVSTVDPSFGAAESPDVAVDASGGAVAIWAQSDRDLDSIYANRFTAGSGWGVPELLENSLESAARVDPARVSVSLNGTAFAIWGQFFGDNEPVWVSRLAADTGGVGTPIARAGADRIVDDGTSVILDASASSDPDGTITRYLWTQVSGTRLDFTGGSLTDTTTASPTFTAPNLSAGAPDQIFGLQLTVVDDTSKSAADTITLTVRDVNRPPTVDAGADQTADEGAFVSLNGAGSFDPDGFIANFSWTQVAGPAVVLNGADFSSQPSFIAPVVDADTTLTFELTVTDNLGLTATDTVSVLVLNSDTDNDGLPDAWEIQHFGNLDQGPNDDFDGDGLSNLREFQDGTDPTVPVPPEPVGPIMAIPGDSQVTLVWGAVDTAVSFNVYWSTTAGVTRLTGNQITGANSLFVHTGLTNGQTYHYVVTSVNSTGESVESAETSATPLATGAGWTLAQLLAGDFDVEARDARIAMDAFGNALAVWTQFDSDGNFLYARRFGVASGWGTPERIAGNAFGPELAMDANGNAVVVWTRFDTSTQNVYANRFTVAGGWQSAELIETNDDGSAFGPRIVIDSNGNAMAVWSQFESNFLLNIWANRFDVSTGWGVAQLIEFDDFADAFSPAVAVDPAGNAIAVWSQSDGTADSIFANRFDVSGSWGVPVLIETNNNSAFSPVVAMDAGGNAIAVWIQFDTAADSVFANRFDAGAGWGVAELIEANNVGDAFLPQVAMDAAGNATAMWQQFNGTFSQDEFEDEVENRDLWANRFVLGSGWTTAPIQLSGPGGSVEGADLALNPSGTAMAVWVQHDGTIDVSERFHTDLWARRFEPSSGWDVAGRIEDHGDRTFGPRVAIDDLGNAIAVWLQDPQSNAGTPGRSQIQSSAYIWVNRFAAP